jgi:hypothetical protein
LIDFHGDLRFSGSPVLLAQNATLFNFIPLYMLYYYHATTFLSIFWTFIYYIFLFSAFFFFFVLGDEIKTRQKKTKRATTKQQEIPTQIRQTKPSNPSQWIVQIEPRRWDRDPYGRHLLFAAEYAELFTIWITILLNYLFEFKKIWTCNCKKSFIRPI